MRLIDADKLLKGKTDHKMISTHIIWNALTVEAIPIEWLNKVIEHYRENCWYDDAEDLEVLINDWREEQSNDEV